MGPPPKPRVRMAKSHLNKGSQAAYQVRLAQVPCPLRSGAECCLHGISSLGCCHQLRLEQQHAELARLPCIKFLLYTECYVAAGNANAAELQILCSLPFFIWRAWIEACIPVHIYYCCISDPKEIWHLGKPRSCTRMVDCLTWTAAVEALSAAQAESGSPGYTAAMWHLK